MTQYHIAFALESGEWEIAESFEAADDDAANEYAETHYPGQEWYVLNAERQNINA